MSYLVIARKYRPQVFEEIVGQEHISTTLKNAIAQKRIAHAYLFSGPRGVGKTTTARILAKALKCEKGPTPIPCNKCIYCKEITEGNAVDVIEIDGASNRRIDEIRNLRENVKFAPATGRYKIYIIDEVHMLTPEAFNALLKTLEEPPPHVIFMMATTEPHRIPVTILSRTQRFNFKLIPYQKIMENLNAICKNEGIEIEDKAMSLIVRSAGGSLRDAQSVLDQAVSYTGKKVDLKQTLFLLGVIPEDILLKFADFISEKKAKEALELLARVIEDGFNIQQLVNDMRQFYRNLLIVKISERPGNIINISNETLHMLRERAKGLNPDQISWVITILSQTEETMKWSEHPRVILEVNLFKLCQGYVPIGQIIAKIESLEKELAGKLPEESTPESPKGGLDQNRELKEDIPEKEEHNQTSHRDSVQSGNNIAFSDVVSRWPEVLERVKKESVSFLSCLSEGRLDRLVDSTLYIAFSKQHAFHKGLVMKKERLVRNILKEVYKEPLQINCIEKEREPESVLDEASIEELEEASIPTPEPPPAFANPDEIEEKEPMVSKILEMFGGEIVDDE